MYDFLRATHSIIRYIILLGGIGAIITIIMAMRHRVRLFSTIFLVSCHIQFVIGMVLYFGFTDWFTMLKDNAKVVMKNSMYRFFTIEHTLMMLIAIVLVTIGHSKLKKALKTDGKLKPSLILFIIAIIVMLAAIPWPFREALGRNWM